MILGLKGKIKEYHDELQRLRAGTFKGDGALSGKRDVTFAEYLGAKCPEGRVKNSEVFDMQHLYAELGVNPNTMTVEQLIDLDQDSRWLVPEIFRDAIRKGLRTAPYYNKLVSASETVAQPQVNMPYVDLSDAEPQDTAEAESISTGSISYGNKVVEVSKSAIGIDISYEAIQYTSLNLLTIFIQDVGVKLGHKLNNKFVSILVDGDQDSGAEAAAVIGVDNTTTGLVYKDILLAWIRASRLGRLYDSIVASEAMANKILNLTEFKDKQQGTPQQAVIVNETLPAQSQIYVTSQLGDNEIVMLDKRFAMVQLTAAPLSVEGERIVRKQIQGTFASITTGFANIFRDARVVVDDSLLYSGNPFPAFMTPTI